MKLICVVLLFCFCGVAFAQEEPPEPTSVTVEYVLEEDFQMVWRHLSPQLNAWTNVTPVAWTDGQDPPVTHPAVEFVDGILGSHKSVVGIGTLVLEAESPDSILAAPRKVVFGIPAGSIPSNPDGTGRWWGICFVRWRARASANGFTSDPSNFSNRSWWILVVGMFTVAIPINT